MPSAYTWSGQNLSDWSETQNLYDWQGCAPSRDVSLSSIHGKQLIPLSPPTSPPTRMSASNEKSDELTWQHARFAGISSGLPSSYPLQMGSSTATAHGPANALLADNSFLSRSHPTIQTSLDPYNRLKSLVSPDEPSSVSSEDMNMQSTSHDSGIGSATDMEQSTFDTLNTEPPSDHLTPRSPRRADEQNEAPIKDEDVDFGCGDEDESQPRPTMTAAELRAHKRKMKRFRLTHNQARFLMGEFARQPHPDASHRERLSREIPGLSPRQVQVWFQNRRAKLKRLTNDDRERMMRSRALPADFDLAQALHAPFSAPTPIVRGQPTFDDMNPVRPLTLDTLRRVPDYTNLGQHNPNTTGLNPAMVSYTYTPPQTSTGANSPSATTASMPPYGHQSLGYNRRPSYRGSIAAQPRLIGQQTPTPQFKDQERFTRSYGDAPGSPLRNSMSYSGFDLSMQAQANGLHRAQSLPGEQSRLQGSPVHSRNNTYPSVTSAGLYGLGFTYASSTSDLANTEPVQISPVPISQSSIGTTDYRTSRPTHHLNAPPPYLPPTFTNPFGDVTSHLAPQQPYRANDGDLHGTSESSRQSNLLQPQTSFSSSPQRTLGISSTQPYMFMSSTASTTQQGPEGSTTALAGANFYGQ